MSKSRLEKFLYALYSLDSSDLPTPLSRIEELYKCLVTRDEAPTFEPLSRVEKYLMAILGAYDADSLPNPLSRVEVLLYKLATGDDNLDDVKSFLSEHEELLAEIIRNGGIGENIDIEYVLYTLSTEFNTLYNTAEKPVKSAILTGQTLVNLASENKIGTYKGDNVASFLAIPLTYDFKDDTTYTIFYTLSNTCRGEVSLRGMGNNPIYGVTTKDLEKGVNIAKITTGTLSKTSPTNVTIAIRGGDNEVTISDIVVLEGDYTNQDIPYFEGMQSVKMPVLTTTGKNLFYGEIERGSYHSSTTTKIDSDKTRCRSSIIPLIPDGFKCRAMISKGFQFYLRLFKDGKVVKESGFSTFYPLDNTSNTFSEVTIVIRKVDNTEITDDELATIKIQIEEGSEGTEYEPFKSNILTVNEDVELRGIGEVQDTLDLMTGEVTERISEIVLDGSDDEDWTINGYNSPNVQNTIGFKIPIPNMKKENLSSIINNRIPSLNVSNFTNYIVGMCTIIFNNEPVLHIRLSSEITGNNLLTFKQWLSQNPITVRYQLATESIKTVDLSVVDQDGDSTKLSTFDDITYVTLSSEGLIPEAELKVATKNEEVLSTLSLEMDDISTAQTTLEETSNTQSENVDATMIATTEIYEGLL